MAPKTVGGRDEKPTAKIHAKIGSARAKVESGEKTNATATANKWQGTSEGGSAQGGVAGLKARASAASIEIPNNRVECTSVVKNEQNITETGENGLEKMQKFRVHGGGGCWYGEKGGKRRGLNGNDLHRFLRFFFTNMARTLICSAG